MCKIEELKVLSSQIERTVDTIYDQDRPIAHKVISEVYYELADKIGLILKGMSSLEKFELDKQKVKLYI